MENVNMQSEQSVTRNGDVVTTGTMSSKPSVFESFGNITLEVYEPSEKDKKYVPQESIYIDNKRILETIATGISENMPVLLIGETGVGKTSAVRYIANKCNVPLRRMNLNGSTTVDEFVGKILLDKEGTYWVDGVLIDAMRKGHWVVLDEINVALPEILFVLNSLLDDDGYVVLLDKDGEVVRPHANFRVFATMNPTEGYAGTKDLNKSLTSRFTMTLRVDLPTEAEERKMVEKRYPELKFVTTDKLKNMIKFAGQLRNAYFKGTNELFLSPREMLAWVHLSELFSDITRGAEMTLCNKTNSQEANSIRDLLKLNFGLSVNDYLPSCKTKNQYAVGDKVVISKPRSGNGEENIETRPNVFLVEVTEAEPHIDEDGTVDAMYCRYSIKVIATNARGENAESDIALAGTTAGIKLGRYFTTLYNGEGA